MSIKDLAHDEVCLLRLQADHLRAENAKLRAALLRAREDMYDLGESDELLAPAVERIDAALAVSR